MCKITDTDCGIPTPIKYFIGMITLLLIMKALLATYICRRYPQLDEVTNAIILPGTRSDTIINIPTVVSTRR